MIRPTNFCICVSVVILLTVTPALGTKLTFNFYRAEPIATVPYDVRRRHSTEKCSHLYARLSRTESGETTSTYRDLKRDTDIYHEVLEHLSFVNRRFLENSPYTPDTLKEFHLRESEFPLKNTTYLVVTDSVEGAIATTRIFDPNVEPVMARLPLEEHLNGGKFSIPRRLLHQRANMPFQAVELGRYAVINGIPQAPRSLLKGVAAHLIFRYISADNTNYNISPNSKTMWVYIQSREVLVPYMEKLGFKKVAGPFQDKPGDPKEYVLEMSARDLFDNYFYQNSFSAIPESRR